MANIRDIAKFLLFLAGGFVAIVVGSFMIRGTMHMWDKPENKKSDKENND